jgi:hypothetical protein
MGALWPRAKGQNIRWTSMDRKPASHLSHVVWIVEKLWINATFDFQRAIHLSHI